jgi:hypothetical protein
MCSLKTRKYEELRDLADEKYNEAKELSDAHLDPTNPLRLAVCLNYA